MAVAVSAEELIIKNTGQTTTVPDDQWAKLMYYLNCVNTVISFGLPKNITDYENYQKLTLDDKNYILMIAEVMKPSLFEEHKIFIDDYSLVQSGHRNSFYDISYKKVALAATKDFVIAGKRVQTLSIMCYYYEWKKLYYNEPFEFFQDHLADVHSGKAIKFRNAPSKACILI